MNSILGRSLLALTIVGFTGALHSPAVAQGNTAQKSAAATSRDVLASQSRDWPMFRGNSRLTGVAGSTLPEKPVVLWKFAAGEVVESSAAIVDGVVYVGCEDGILYALNLNDGSVRWKYTIDVPIRSSPTVADGAVYFGDDDGTFHAVRASNGKVLWKFKAGTQIISSANVARDRLVFGSYDGFLYCLRTADGSLIWKFETQGKVHGTPAIVDQKVMIAGCDGMLRVLSLSDGSSIAEVSLDGYSGASAAIVGTRAYAGTFENEVKGIDLEALRVDWTYQHPVRSFPFLSSAAATERIVVIGGRDKMVHALDPATGRARWVFATQGRVDGSPVIVGERVFVGSADGILYALDLETGAEEWRFEAGAGFYASPAIADGVLVIGTDDGMVYCLGAKVPNRNVKDRAGQPDKGSHASNHDSETSG